MFLRGRHSGGPWARRDVDCGLPVGKSQWMVEITPELKPVTGEFDHRTFMVSIVGTCDYIQQSTENVRSTAGHP